MHPQRAKRGRPLFRRNPLQSLAWKILGLAGRETAVSGSLPSTTTALILSTQRTCIRCRAATVAEPVCGWKKIFGAAASRRIGPIGPSCKKRATIANTPGQQHSLRRPRTKKITQTHERADSRAAAQPRTRRGQLHRGGRSQVHQLGPPHPPEGRGPRLKSSSLYISQRSKIVNESRPSRDEWSTEKLDSWGIAGSFTRLHCGELLRPEPKIEPQKPWSKGCLVGQNRAAAASCGFVGKV